MDFGGFILFLILALSLLAISISIIADFIRRRLFSRRRSLALIINFVVIIILGFHIYHVYWLDEMLFIAAAEGDTVQVKSLLAAGANPNATWEDGTSAISAARSRKYDEIVKVLKDAGATN